MIPKSGICFKRLAKSVIKATTKMKQRKKGAAASHAHGNRSIALGTCKLAVLGKPPVLWGGLTCMISLIIIQYERA